MKPEATGDRLIPKTPRAIICDSANEKIVVLWTMGHNRPPVSYFETYTLSIWKIYLKHVNDFLKREREQITKFQMKTSKLNSLVKKE